MKNTLILLTIVSLLNAKDFLIINGASYHVNGRIASVESTYSHEDDIGTEEISHVDPTGATYSIVTNRTTYTNTKKNIFTELNLGLGYASENNIDEFWVHGYNGSFFIDSYSKLALQAGYHIHFKKNMKSIDAGIGLNSMILYKEEIKNSFHTGVAILPYLFFEKNGIRINVSYIPDIKIQNTKLQTSVIMTNIYFEF